MSTASRIVVPIVGAAILAAGVSAAPQADAIPVKNVKVTQKNGPWVRATSVQTDVRARGLKSVKRTRSVSRTTATWTSVRSA